MDKKISIQGPLKKITCTIRHSTKPHPRYVHMNAISTQFKMLLFPPNVGNVEGGNKTPNKGKCIFDKTYT
jgi:hypothetical protein